MSTSASSKCSIWEWLEFSKQPIFSCGVEIEQNMALLPDQLILESEAKLLVCSLRNEAQQTIPLDYYGFTASLYVKDSSLFYTCWAGSSFTTRPTPYLVILSKE